MKNYVKTFESFKYDMLKQEKLNESRSSRYRRLYENEGIENTIIQGLFALVKVGAIKDYESLINFVLNLTGKEFKELFKTDNPTSFLINILNICKIPYQTQKGLVRDKGDNLYMYYIPKLRSEGMNWFKFFEDVEDTLKGFIPFANTFYKKIQDNELVGDYDLTIPKIDTNNMEMQLNDSDVMTMKRYFGDNWTYLKGIFNKPDSEKLIFKPLASALKSKEISPELKKQLPDMIAKLSDKTKKYLTLDNNVKKELDIS